MNIFISEEEIRELMKLFGENENNYTGKRNECIIKKSFEQQGYEVNMIDSKDNINYGDMVINKDNDSKIIEVKSANRFDYACLDVKYTSKYVTNDRGYTLFYKGESIKLPEDKLGIVPYNQSTTGNSAGFIYNKNYEQLVFLTKNSIKRIWILDGQYFLQISRNIISELVAKYNFEEFRKEWYDSDIFETSIELDEYPYIKFWTNKHDEYKDTYTICFKLSEEAFRYYGIDFDVVDLNIKEKSPSIRRRRT